MVHGRGDPSLRSATTLEGLSSLAKGGYVGREDALTLGEAYRLLRTLEHRIQALPPPADPPHADQRDRLRRLGRAIGLKVNPAKEVVEVRASRSREVRRIHERLFYRPLLNAAAKAHVRGHLAHRRGRPGTAGGLGFRDPAGRCGTSGAHLGRHPPRAIQRTLLPVMLGWFADEADPDAGLLAFRRVSEEWAPSTGTSRCFATRAPRRNGWPAFSAAAGMRRTSGALAGVGRHPRRAGRAHPAQPERAGSPSAAPRVVARTRTPPWRR